MNWRIEKRKTSELQSWQQNPRKITDPEFRQLKRQLKEQGFHDVVVIDTDNTILSGNQRKRALEELGVEEVYCMVPERKLTEEERDRQRIAIRGRVKRSEDRQRAGAAKQKYVLA